jgi:PAS domain S-box-containing protein
VSAAIYLALAVYVSRLSPHSLLGYFLFLVGILVTGTVFTYASADPHLYGIGRTLSFFAAGFLPVAFYAIYRQYTSGLPGTAVLVLLSVIPVLTTLLAMTNSLHNMIWDVVQTPLGPRFTDLTDHFWFNRIHSPFAYGLFGYSLVALAARLGNIAPAHRRPLLLLIACATFPFLISIANNFLGLGPADFPFLSLTLTLLLPVFAYASVSLRVFEFSPVAYQTLFNHVRDPIIVLDNGQRIICANRSATELLGKTEAALLGRLLWEDVPEARAILEHATELDLTQTLTLDTKHTYELGIAPLLDAHGRRQGSVVVCRDVTERRKALSQLADSEHLIRTLIETSSNGILRFARGDSGAAQAFHCVFANRAAESHLGCNSESLVGRHSHPTSRGSRAPWTR